MNQWWKHTVFYQIYMPSFCDGNGDGIGDFIGIRSKLEYLKQLGVGCVWLTPFYPSPKVDQGYDVSDYENVDPDYGTLEDFRRTLCEAAEDCESVTVVDGRALVPAEESCFADGLHPNDRGMAFFAENLLRQL